MDYLKEFAEELLELRKIDKELEKGPINHKGEQYRSVNKEEGRGKTYPHGVQGSKYFFVKGEDQFKLASEFFSTTLTKLMKEYKDGKLSENECRKAILTKITLAGDAFEKELKEKGIDTSDISVQMLQKNIYFLTDTIFEIITGKKKEVQHLFDEVLAMADELRKYKRTSATAKTIFDTFVKHFKIVDKLIDMVLDKGGREVVNAIKEYEARED